MKKIIVMALVLCAAVFGRTYFSTAEVLDKVIVVVNDEVITQREFDRGFEQIKKTYLKDLTGDQLKEETEKARKSYLDQLINTKVVVSLAKKEKIKADEGELKNRIDKIKSFYGTDEEFLKALSDRGTNLTEFENDIKEQMIAQSVVEKEVASKIVITPADVDELYQKNKEMLVAPKRAKVREIMIRKTPEDADGKAAKAKIEKIAVQLKKKGVDFAETAKTSSEGPYAANGGDMGYVVAGQFLESIDSAIFNTTPGSDTGVVETSVGYHIFKVETIEEPRPLEFKEVSDFLKNELFRKRFEANLMKWIEEKKKNAYIAYK